MPLRRSRGVASATKDVSAIIASIITFSPMLNDDNNAGPTAHSLHFWPQWNPAKGSLHMIYNWFTPDLHLIYTELRWLQWSPAGGSLRDLHLIYT
jgi:hypothetical protein